MLVKFEILFMNQYWIIVSSPLRVIFVGKRSPSTC